jgi:hypothetical protein
MAKKNKHISVLGKTITIDKRDYISLTDMLKAKDGDFFISDWLRNRNTLEYPGINVIRSLTKINYRIHTDAVKEHLIPSELSEQEAELNERISQNLAKSKLENE